LANDLYSTSVLADRDTVAFFLTLHDTRLCPK
jgi:hypothetical protein